MLADALIVIEKVFFFVCQFFINIIESQSDRGNKAKPETESIMLPLYRIKEVMPPIDAKRKLTRTLNFNVLRKNVR